ncbi:MAG TPA: SRPBCC family protein [Actinomycetales bacterium]|nr:SRPBCC family protein [Actinomycetales bacterium]
MTLISDRTWHILRDALRGRVHASRLIDLDASALFSIVSDVRFHGRWVPLTRIKAPLRRIEPGDSFSAHTLGLRDAMTLVSISDGVAHFRKEGPLLFGSSDIAVREVAPGVGRVSWDYDVSIGGPLPRFIARALAGLVLAPILRIVIDRMEADIAANKHRLNR